MTSPPESPARNRLNPDTNDRCLELCEGIWHHRRQELQRAHEKHPGIFITLLLEESEAVLLRLEALREREEVLANFTASSWTMLAEFVRQNGGTPEFEDALRRLAGVWVEDH